MTAEVFGSARLKHERATFHLQMLVTEMREFLSQEPPVVTSVPGVDGKNYLMMRESIPDAWCMTIGDCLQNLRSALEHAAYEVTLAYSPSTKPSSIQFPIAASETEWFGKSRDKGGQNRWVKAASSEAQLEFLELQPFKAAPGDEVRDPLYVLNELAKVDRHRVAHLCLASTRGTFVGFDPMVRRGNVPVIPGPYGPTWFVAGTAMNDGRLQVFVDDGETPADVDTYSHQGFGVFFDLGEAERPVFDVVDSLSSIAGYIDQVVFPRLAPHVQN